MNQAKFENTLLTQLARLKEVTAIRNEKGELLGHFVPVGKSFFVPPPEDCCPHNPEELARLRSQTSGMPLSQFWKTLGVK